VFQHADGVTTAVSGYADGAANAAHYEMVGTNTTGHAESVRMTLRSSPHQLRPHSPDYFSVAHDRTELNWLRSVC
jgi:peptide-methionine (S)-S-oxide reductase